MTCLGEMRHFKTFFMNTISFENAYFFEIFEFKFLLFLVKKQEISKSSVLKTKSLRIKCYSWKILKDVNILFAIFIY